MNRSVLGLFKLADEETQDPTRPKKVEISEFPHCTRLRRELTDKVSLVLKMHDAEMCREQPIRSYIHQLGEKAGHQGWDRRSMDHRDVNQKNQSADSSN